MTVTDCARLEAEDLGELVAASLACPWNPTEQREGGDDGRLWLAA